MNDPGGRPLVGGTATTLWRGDPDYEATRVRMVWNERRPARYPEVIVTAASAALAAAGRSRCVNPELRDVLPLLREHLNSIVSAVTDVDEAVVG